MLPAGLAQAGMIVGGFGLRASTPGFEFTLQMVRLRCHQWSGCRTGSDPLITWRPLDNFNKLHYLIIFDSYTQIYIYIYK